MVFKDALKKGLSDCLYQKFLSILRESKLLISLTDIDGCRWLKSVDEKLKSQPKQFWKYVASFGKRNSNSVQLEVDAEQFIEPCDVDDDFSNLFQSVYNNSWPVIFPTLSSSFEFLSLVPVSDSDIFKANKHFKPPESVVVDDIPGFIIEGFNDIFVFLPCGSKQQFFLF
jgi:hypothetical protein